MHCCPCGVLLQAATYFAIVSSFPKSHQKFLRFMFYLQVFVVLCFISLGGWGKLSFMDFFSEKWRTASLKISQQRFAICQGLPCSMAGRIYVPLLWVLN